MKQIHPGGKAMLSSILLKRLTTLLPRRSARLLGTTADLSESMKESPPDEEKMPTTTADLFLTLVQRQDHQTTLLRSEMQTGFAAQDQKLEGLRSEMQAGFAAQDQKLEGLRSEMLAQGKELRSEMQAGFARLEAAIQGINQQSEKRSNSEKNWAWGLFLTSGTAFTSLLYLIYDEQRQHRESIYTLKRLHPELAVPTLKKP
ncbi:MAG: hypothetical protein DHS20C10_13370 [marine bacterium B5-7]|nr:MAG: hypothetical protein DHS20C10_13370 [marine bacterium B5-7]